MKIKVCLAAGCFLMAGCDQVQNTVDNVSAAVFRNADMKKPVVVLPPGLAIDDHGKKSVLYGDERCPESQISSVIVSSVIGSGCILIKPEDKTVVVNINTVGEPRKKEVWLIEHVGQYPKEVVRLKRPDGSYVTPWGKEPVIVNTSG